MLNQEEQNPGILKDTQENSLFAFDEDEQPERQFFNEPENEVESFFQAQAKPKKVRVKREQTVNTSATAKNLVIKSKK